MKKPTMEWWTVSGKLSPEINKHYSLNSVLIKHQVKCQPSSIAEKS